MTTKTAETAKKEPSLKSDAAGGPSDELSMTTLTRLLDNHHKPITEEFKTAIASVESKLVQIQTSVLEHNQKISALETPANSVENRMLALETSCSSLKSSNAKLIERLVDLESRRRLNNIRIVGLPESVEGPQPSSFFSELLMETFDFFSSPPEVDRAHRTRAAKPRPEEKPRAVVIRLHHFQHKDKIIREARNKRDTLQYKGTPFAIYEDYVPEVVEQRVKYREVLAAFYKLGLKPALLFPARLSVITKDGVRKRFSSVEEARDYLSALRSEDVPV